MNAYCQEKIYITNAHFLALYVLQLNTIGGSDMYEKTFSKRLSQLRLKKGVSARDMSLSLGQSESYINRIENQQMLPSMTVFFYICDYFGITPKEFFDFEDNSSLELIELINNLKTLDNETLCHINHIVRKIK